MGPVLYSKRYSWVILFLGISSMSLAEPGTPSIGTGGSSPKSLKDAYLAALTQSETIGIQKEILSQADEIENQAGSALYPNIAGSATTLRQQTPTQTTGNTISSASQNTVKITADQPLFRGLRDFAALRQRKALTAAQEYALQTAARQLFYDVTAAYYNVLTLLSDQANYENEIEVNRTRLKELQTFLRIGRSRSSELLTFQSNISALEANLAASRTQLESAKDVLAYLTGWNREIVLQNNETPPANPGEVTNYLAKLEERPEVQTAVSNVKAFEEGIPIARGQHFPSVDLLGDYYLDRPGALSNVNWDVQLALTVPIFQGGAIQSQVRQAESVSRQYSLLLSQARRAAEQEIRTFYDALTGDQKQQIKLSETVDWSKKNYEAELKDYRNGLVTNLDVLTAITGYQDAQRLLDRAKFIVIQDAAKLQAATAQRPEVSVPRKDKP